MRKSSVFLLFIGLMTLNVIPSTGLAAPEIQESFPYTATLRFIDSDGEGVEASTSGQMAVWTKDGEISAFAIPPGAFVVDIDSAEPDISIDGENVGFGKFFSQSPYNTVNSPWAGTLPFSGEAFVDTSPLSIAPLSLDDAFGEFESYVDRVLGSIDITLQGQPFWMTQDPFQYGVKVDGIAQNHTVFHFETATYWEANGLDTRANMVVAELEVNIAQPASGGTGTRCGLGFEVALLLPIVQLFRRRRQ